MHPSLSQSVAYTEVMEIKRDYINTIQHSLPLREQPLNSTGAMSECVRSGDILSIWDLSHSMDTGRTWSLGEGKMQFASRLGWFPPIAGTPSPDQTSGYATGLTVRSMLMTKDQSLRVTSSLLPSRPYMVEQGTCLSW